MTHLKPPEVRLIEAIASRAPELQLNSCMASLKPLFRTAIQKDPRILAFLSGYQARSVRGALPLSHDYTILLRYREDGADALDDVIVDQGSWDPASLFTGGRPREAMVATTDVPGLRARLSEKADMLIGRYEGFCGWSSSSAGFDELSDWQVVQVGFQTLLPEPQLRQCQSKAAFAARTIWHDILGRARVPKFVMPFLAFSWLSQECLYDQRAYDEAKDSPDRAPSDPVVHLACGPLVERRGICGGFAWAFKYLMDEAGIPCLCVPGSLRKNGAPGWQDGSWSTTHMWNLVQINGQYYHVDATQDVRGDSVMVAQMMQPDAMFASTHLWDRSAVPTAVGTRFDYDFVENYLAENGQQFLDDGASERYFFPRQIID